LEVAAEAEKPPGSPKVKNVKLKVTATADTSTKKLEALWRRTEANCPVLYIFTDANPVKTELELVGERD